MEIGPGRRSTSHYDRATAALWPRDCSKSFVVKALDLTSGHVPRVKERRCYRRYPIVATLKYTLLRRNQVVRCGDGRTLNLSSHGVLFLSELALPPGMRVSLSIALPPRFNGEAESRLCVMGRTVRREDRATAVAFERRTLHPPQQKVRE
jgi:hypothetical protein